MRLRFYELDGKPHYEACVWVNGNKCLLSEFYTTKAEAIKAVKICKKSYKGNNELDCFVRLYDEDGFGIKDYNL